MDPKTEKGFQKLVFGLSDKTQLAVQTVPQSIFWQKIQIIVGFFYPANHAVDV